MLPLCPTIPILECVSPMVIRGAVPCYDGLMRGLSVLFAKHPTLSIHGHTMRVLLKLTCMDVVFFALACTL